MREQEPIKSFEKLDEIFDEQREKEIQDTFERVLKDKFHKASPGMFDSTMPEIESIIITPVIPQKGRQSINATIKYINKDGKPRNVIFSIFEDGVISGRMPHDLNISRDDLSLEILKTIERINFNFWRKTDLDILPDSDEVNRQRLAEKEDKELKEEETGDSLNRMERLEFLEQQPRIICGFVNGNNGFKGYHGAVFSSFILLEHPRFGNAAYIIDIKKPMKIDKDTFNRSPDKRVDQKTYEEILASAWKPISEKAKSRGVLRREFGAQRVIHTPNTWKEKLQEAINSRLRTEKTSS